MKSEIFTCSCHSLKHLVRVSLDADDDFPAVYFDVAIDHTIPLYKRILYGFRYILGFGPSNMLYEEVVFDCHNVDDIKRMVGILNDGISVIENKQAGKDAN